MDLYLYRFEALEESLEDYMIELISYIYMYISIYVYKYMYISFICILNVLGWQLSNCGFFLENQRQFFYGTK